MSTWLSRLIQSKSRDVWMVCDLAFWSHTHTIVFIYVFIINLIQFIRNIFLAMNCILLRKWTSHSLRPATSRVKCRTNSLAGVRTSGYRTYVYLWLWRVGFKYGSYVVCISCYSMEGIFTPYRVFYFNYCVACWADALCGYRIFDILFIYLLVFSCDN